MNQKNSENSQIKLRMNPRIPNILPHIRQQHLHLLQLPPEHRGEEPQREGLEPVFDLDEVEGTDCFLFGFLGCIREIFVLGILRGFRGREEGQEGREDEPGACLWARGR